MPDNSRFRALSVKERAIVAVAVLLDGHDASSYLMSDKERGVALIRVAKDLAEFAPDLRMPLLGTMLRMAIAELESEQTV